VHYGRKDLEPGPHDRPAGDDHDDSPPGGSSGEPDDGRLPALIY
jgi:hypothetical protein